MRLVPERAQTRLSKAAITDRFAPLQVGFGGGDRSIVDYDFGALAEDFSFRADLANIQVNSRRIVAVGMLHRSRLLALETDMEARRGVPLENAIEVTGDFVCEPRPVE